TYGPRTVDLINITNNDICSLFYYSCSITNKFSTTQLNACGTIQTTALRTALGLPNWTPNVVLLKISGQETLADKMKRLAVKFFIKQISNNDYSSIHSCRQNLSIHLTKKDEESLLAHLTDLNISPNHIITLRLRLFSVKSTIFTPRIWVFKTKPNLQHSLKGSSMISSATISKIILS
ncbi:hypothetical protein AVEN_29300-1, partial [Araneus ventricosus]